MSTGKSTAHPTLNVFFTFGNSWEIGPAPRDETSREGEGIIVDIYTFPPGGGGHGFEESRPEDKGAPGYSVVIKPLDLSAMDDTEIVRTLAHRAEAIAMVAQAVAIAQADLAAAVAAIKR